MAFDFVGNGEFQGQHANSGERKKGRKKERRKKERKERRKPWQKV